MDEGRPWAEAVAVEGDEGKSVGLFAVQKWPAYGIDFYTGFRRYELRRPDIDLKDLNVPTFGVALHFYLRFRLCFGHRPRCY